MGPGVSCNLGAVSIQDRISSFQDDLNTTSRSNLYKNFHPTETIEYDALKNPAAITGFTTLFPLPSPNYSLSIIDDNNTSAVHVQVVAGPSGGTYNPSAFYLELKMDTTSGNDNRIVTLSASNTNGGYTLYLQ
jgi:hypothetical protein